MPAESTQSGLQFLSVAQAAELLGISRLKIREAAAKGVIPAQWDNERRLRVDLTGVTAKTLGSAKGKIEQSDLLDMLFDEVEELHEALLAREAEAQALKGLAGRQAQALDDAADRMERDAAEKARLSDLLARAMDHLESQPAGQGTEKLAQISDRALAHLETTGTQLETALAQSGRLDHLLERAIALAEASKAEGANQTAEMRAATERAMGMLDRAMSEIEASRHVTHRTGDMLDRALQAGERLEGKVAQQEQEIKAQGQSLDKALALSERAVALANTDPPRRRTFWQWITGQ